MNRISSKISIEIEMLKRNRTKCSANARNMTAVEEVSVSEYNEHTSGMKDVVVQRQPNGMLTNKCTAVSRISDLKCDEEDDEDEEEQQQQQHPEQEELGMQKNSTKPRLLRGALRQFGCQSAVGQK